MIFHLGVMCMKCRCPIVSTKCIAPNVPWIVPTNQLNRFVGATVTFTKTNANWRKWLAGKNETKFKAFFCQHKEIFSCYPLKYFNLSNERVLFFIFWKKVEFSVKKKFSLEANTTSYPIAFCKLFFKNYYFLRWIW